MNIQEQGRSADNIAYAACSGEFTTQEIAEEIRRFAWDTAYWFGERPKEWLQKCAKDPNLLEGLQLASFQNTIRRRGWEIQNET